MTKKYSEIEEIAKLQEFYDEVADMWTLTIKENWSIEGLQEASEKFKSYQERLDDIFRDQFDFYQFLENQQEDYRQHEDEHISASRVARYSKSLMALAAQIQGRLKFCRNECKNSLNALIENEEHYRCLVAKNESRSG